MKNNFLFLNVQTGCTIALLAKKLKGKNTLRAQAHANNVLEYRIFLQRYEVTAKKCALS
jgi:hypothetical protein